MRRERGDEREGKVAPMLKAYLHLDSHRAASSSVWPNSLQMR
jgi:hypothetical protein